MIRLSPCFIIAEAGVNHNGDLKLAMELIDVAFQAKADAVKFQTFSAERLVTRSASKAEYQRKTTDARESQFDMLQRLELSQEAHFELKEYAEKKGILFLSTPFDEISADFLSNLGVPAFKIPSGEITNLPFLEHVAKKMRPMIVSTGMATLDEVRVAVKKIRETGNNELALLHCVSAYPAEPSWINLRAMETLAHTFEVPVGFSDHTTGIEISLAAVALGAKIIEKHFTLDRKLPGPDHGASLEPEELCALVAGIRKVESALGDGRKIPHAEEKDTADAARKSLVAAKDIVAGDLLTEEVILIQRPGTGLPPSLRSQLVGKRAKISIAAGELLTWEMFT